LPGMADLLIRDINAGDVALALLGHKTSNLAPAATDVKDPVTRGQIQLAAYQVKLLKLRHVEILRVLVIGAAVVLVLPQERAEEVIVQVVMVRGAGRKAPRLLVRQ